LATITTASNRSSSRVRTASNIGEWLSASSTLLRCMLWPQSRWSHRNPDQFPKTPFGFRDRLNR
jgi:hypothetical protein